MKIQDIHFEEMNNMLLAFNEMMNDDNKLFDTNIILHDRKYIVVSKKVLYHLIKNQKVT